MKMLSKNWITEKHLDFEYKKYVLLGYLQEVAKSFDANKLYPCFSDIIEHYKNVVLIKNNKENLSSSFHKHLSRIDLSNLQLVYEHLEKNNSFMDELEQIIDFSIPQFEQYLQEGKKIYTFIEQSISIQPIGVLPLRTDEGYMLIKDGKKAETNVYQYNITLIQEPNERFRGIQTQYVRSFSASLRNSFDGIKTDLIKTYKELPNPATFAFESELEFPLAESFLPVAKRSLIQYMVANKTLE